MQTSEKEKDEYKGFAGFVERLCATPSKRAALKRVDNPKLCQLGLALLSPYSSINWQDSHEQQSAVIVAAMLARQDSISAPEIDFPQAFAEYFSDRPTLAITRWRHLVESTTADDFFARLSVIVRLLAGQAETIPNAMRLYSDLQAFGRQPEDLIAWWWRKFLTRLHRLEEPLARRFDYEDRKQAVERLIALCSPKSTTDKGLLALLKSADNPQFTWHAAAHLAPLRPHILQYDDTLRSFSLLAATLARQKPEKNGSMHFGSVLARISKDEKQAQTKLRRVLAAESVAEVVSILRFVLRQIENADQAMPRLDFVRLAEQLYRFTFPEGRLQTKKEWGQEFFPQNTATKQ